MENRRHVSLVGPTLLIGLGIILLLNNLGYLDWGLRDILQLWPVLLIAAGLELLLGRRSIWGALVAATMVLVLLMGGVWLAETLGRDRIAMQTTEIRYPLQSTRHAVIKLAPGVADLTVTALGSSPNLVEAEVQLPKGQILDHDFSAGAEALLCVRTTDRGPLRYVSPGRDPLWQVRLNPTVTLDLLLDMGIGNSSLLLSHLQVDQAILNFGIGSMHLALPQRDSSITVDGGIGTLQMTVPRELGLRIVMDTGLVARNLPANYVRDGEIYTSPNYAQADYRAEVVIGLGIGTVTVNPVSVDE